MYLNVITCIIKNNCNTDTFTNDEEKEFTRASLITLSLLIIGILKTSLKLTIIVAIALIILTILTPLLSEEKILIINSCCKKMTLKIVDKFIKLTPLAVIAIIFLLIKKYM
jgi:hypothetical protein